MRDRQTDMDRPTRRSLLTLEREEHLRTTFIPRTANLVAEVPATWCRVCDDTQLAGLLLHVFKRHLAVYIIQHEHISYSVCTLQDVSICWQYFVSWFKRVSTAPTFSLNLPLKMLFLNASSGCFLLECDHEFTVQDPAHLQTTAIPWWNATAWHSVVWILWRGAEISDILSTEMLFS
jgi:hypothetical protein